MNILMSLLCCSRSVFSSHRQVRHIRTRSQHLSACLVIISASLSCADVNMSTQGESGPPGALIACENQVLCQGNLARSCIGTPRESSIDCAETGRTCVRDVGCLLCEPEQLSCEGNQVMMCSPDGQSLNPLMTCPDLCEEGRCTNACQREADARSYQGCEYWPTPLSNTVDLGFSFAVGVVNVNQTSVLVQVKRGETLIAEREIAPEALDVIALPWIDELTYDQTSSFNSVQGSARVAQGAYHLTSSSPLIVYQFNPLEYQRVGDCPESNDQDPIDNLCFSYSNDASLLLPAHAFGQEYLVISYPSTAVLVEGRDISTTPSSFQVVSASSGETEVEITFSASVASSLTGDVPGYRAGETATFTLNQGDVLQFVSAPVEACENTQPFSEQFAHCEVSQAGDLSGTLIRANQPIEVFGSHSCAFIPYNVFACDHLEESIFPLSSWGRSAVVPAIKPLIDEPSVVRVISGKDQNLVSFDPPSIHPNVTLNQGESVIFEARESFVVNGGGVLQVSQYLVGQNYSASADLDGFGDPSMSLIPPSDQFRDSYKILAPESYALHYINVVHRRGVEIYLDGAPIAEGEVIANSTWRQLTLEVSGGIHELRGDGPFGVWVYGFGNYTSYMYPGGLDLKVINDVE